MKNIYQVLDSLHIKYQKYHHPAVFTVAEAAKYDEAIDAEHSKNLFLRNKKGDRHYLVVVGASKKIDLKKLETVLHENRLSFASAERLMKFLGVTPGSVSPFGLINDADKMVTVIVDAGLIKSNKLGFHPNENTATLAISSNDFKKFLEWTKNQILYLDL